MQCMSQGCGRHSISTDDSKTERGKAIGKYELDFKGRRGGEY